MLIINSISAIILILIIFLILGLTNIFLHIDWGGLFFKRKTGETENIARLEEIIGNSKIIYRPEPGSTYLVPEGKYAQTGLGMRIFKELVFNNPPGLLISFIDPAKVLKENKLCDVDTIWLSKENKENKKNKIKTISPNNLGALVSAIDSFARTNNSIILLHGCETLTKYVMIENILDFLKTSEARMALSKSSLLISINFEGMADYKAKQLMDCLTDIKHTAWKRETTEDKAECYRYGAVVSLWDSSCPECGAPFE